MNCTISYPVMDTVTNIMNMNIEEIIAHIVTVENGFQHILDAIHYRFLEKEKRSK